MRKKVYGQSRINACPFCDKQSTTTNTQKVPVCQQHKYKQLDNFKCVCGSYLDVKSGKWGPYFSCLNCGNITFRKGLEMNPQTGTLK